MNPYPKRTKARTASLKPQVSGLKPQAFAYDIFPLRRIAMSSHAAMKKVSA